MSAGPAGVCGPRLRTYGEPGPWCQRCERRVGRAHQPEAATAAGAFHEARPDLLARLTGCASGAKLLAMGFDDDNAIAAELNQSHAVPLLGEAGFHDAKSQPDHDRHR